MAYLMIYDDSRKPTAQKIVSGIARYQERFGHAPTLVLVNAMDFTVVEGVRVEVSGYVRPNNFQIGMQIQESAR